MVRKEEIYTIEGIYALSEGHCAELIAGQIYDMAPSSRRKEYWIIDENKN